MESRKDTRTKIFSYSTIIVSLGLLSGLALGHATENSMNARLSASAPLDPVERFGLGRNAFETANVMIRPVSSPLPAYAENHYEIGRYVDGARVLMPFEPARKIERLRLENVHNWGDENFGADSGFGEEMRSDAEDDFADYQPIDVGAVEAAAEAPARPVVVANTNDTSKTTATFINLDERKSEESRSEASRAGAEKQILSHAGGFDRPSQKISGRSHKLRTSSIP